MLCIKCKKEINNDSIFCQFCGKKQVAEQKKTLKRANGTGSVYKLSGRRRKPWVAVISKKVNEKQSKTIIGCYASKTEAMNALDAARINPIPEGYNLTVKEVYESWADKHYKKIDKSTEDSYKSAWLYLEPYSNIKMRSFTSQHIQAAIDSAGEKGRGRATCEKIKTVSGKICTQAMKDDLINKDYSQFVILPEKVEKEKEIFSKDEIKILWENRENRTAQIILVLIYTGPRINELFSMEIENVHIDKRYMVGGSKTDAGKNRIIPLHNDILPFISLWMEENKERKYLLCNQRGNKMNDKNWRSRCFYPFLEELGILEKGVKPPRLTPHSARHTFISEMVKNDSRPEFLQRIVGHEQYETTIDFYTHITEDDIEALISEVDNHLCFAVNNR